MCVFVPSKEETENMVVDIEWYPALQLPGSQADQVHFWSDKADKNY